MNEVARQYQMPEPEQFKRLRAALADFDANNTGRVGDYAGIGEIVDAARDVVKAFDAQMMLLAGHVAQFGGRFVGSGVGTQSFKANPREPGGHI